MVREAFRLVVLSIFEWVVRRAPAPLSRSWLRKDGKGSLKDYQETVRRKLVIDLAGENPIQVPMGAQVPRIDVWFRVANFGLLDLDLVHMVADVWFG